MADTSLTPGQINSLLAIHAFLRAITSYLEAHIPVLQPEDAPHGEALFNMAVICASELVERFPEVAGFENGIL